MPAFNNAIANNAIDTCAIIPDYYLLRTEIQIMFVDGRLSTIWTFNGRAYRIYSEQIQSSAQVSNNFISNALDCPKIITKNATGKDTSRANPTNAKRLELEAAKVAKRGKVAMFYSQKRPVLRAHNIFAPNPKACHHVDALNCEHGRCHRNCSQMTMAAPNKKIALTRMCINSDACPLEMRNSLASSVCVGWRKRKVKKPFVVLHSELYSSGNKMLCGVSSESCTHANAYIAQWMSSMFLLPMPFLMRAYVCSATISTARHSIVNAVVFSVIHYFGCWCFVLLRPVRRHKWNESICCAKV